MKPGCLMVGGDNRQRYLSGLYLQQGYAVYCLGLESCVTLPKEVVHTEAPPPVTLCLLPVPVTRDGATLYAPYAARPIALERLPAYLAGQRVVCGGLVPPSLSRALQSGGAQVYDYGKSEVFARQNALPTAEGGIELALHHTPFVLSGARVCVAGYGRIGKELVRLLVAFGCRVTATARRAEDLAAIKKAGADPLPTAELPGAGAFEVIFNTVPAPVITRPLLRRQTDQTLVLDLASLPGGVEDEAAAQLGVRVIHALSLPAACAPLTAAGAIQTALRDIMQETD